MNRTYKYELHYQYDKEFFAYHSKNLDEPVNFEDKHGNIWLTITQTDDDRYKVYIPSGYAWDGCSPSTTILDLFWMGTPDGVVYYKTGVPKTYHASLVHDALCQFCKNKNMPFSRRVIDGIFYRMLKEVDFKLARIYYIAVRIFSLLKGYVR